MDVEATPARLAQEIIATKAMLERVEQTHHLRPEKLAADKAYGTGPFLGWLSKRKIIPHIPVLDRQHQTDGLLPREVFTSDPDKNHYTCPQDKVSSTAQLARTRQSTSIARRKVIARHAPFVNNAQEASNGVYRYRSTRALGRKSWPSKTRKPFNTHAAYEESRDAVRSHETAVPVHAAQAERLGWSR